MLLYSLVIPYFRENEKFPNSFFWTMNSDWKVKTLSLLITEKPHEYMDTLYYHAAIHKGRRTIDFA